MTRLRPPALRYRAARRTDVDTLAELARRHGISVEQLRRANHLRGSQVRAGQKLKLPG